MTLTDREAATLRAALHCWQNELSYYTTEELQDYYPDLHGVMPLTLEEVDGLLARLLADAPQQEGSEATVSSVRPSAGGAS